MTDIAFYHLQKWPLDKALPKLLEKTLEAGKRAVVMAGSQERLRALNTLLWTYGRDSWLPHGTAREGNAEDQPVWLTTDDENPNGAVFLFLEKLRRAPARPPGRRQLRRQMKKNIHHGDHGGP